MKISIKVTDRKTSSRIDLADFKKKASEIFNNVVVPQIEKAKASKKPTNAVMINNSL